MSQTFASLRYRNFRLWIGATLFGGSAIWMQRVAQDWLALTELSDHSGIQVGIVTALQFVPMLFLTPWAGVVADRVDRRRVVQISQLGNALCAFGLAVIVLSGVAQMWHVYIFALISGVFGAIESPARMAFVSQIVPDKDLPNAAALNAAGFNVSRMIGPAVAGFVIDWVGTGWVFLINGVLLFVPILMLALIRRSELSDQPHMKRARGQLREGVRYVLGRPDIMMVMLIVTVVSGLGLNFQLTSALMATEVYGRAAGDYGLLSTTMALGSLAGSLLAARRGGTRLRLILGSAAVFGLCELALGFAPTYEVFALLTIPTGIASLTMITSANALVQVSTPDQYRGRVMALYSFMFLGTTPVGSPFVGWIGEVLGAPWSLWVGSIGCLAVSFFALAWGMVRWGVRPGWSRIIRRSRSGSPSTTPELPHR